MKTKFTRKINFEPGYDFVVQPTKKHGKEYGRHGMSIRFVLKGEEGVVQFLMFTDWLPRVKKGGMWEPTFNMDNIAFGHRQMFPMAADIGYHSPKPMYEGQIKRDKCDYLGGKPCYYDGSGLYAEEFMAEFINNGEDKLWTKMEGYYKETFNV